MPFKRSRFTLGNDSNGQPLEGWHYTLPCDIYVRRFDKGSIAWFYAPRVKGVMNKQIIVQYRPAGTFEWQKEDEWKVTMTFYHSNSRTTDFFGNGKSRREAFDNVRIDIANAQKSLRKFKCRRPNNDPWEIT